MWGLRALLVAWGAFSALAGAPAFAQYPWHTDQALADAAEFPTWSSALERNATQLSGFADCLADKSVCKGSERSLRVVVLKGAELTREEQVRLVHRYINRRSYRDDRPRRAVSDFTDKPTVFRNQWATLFEFARRGGDCEDYASAKYFLLRELGVPADDLRIVIIRERRKSSYHAVLAVRQPTGEIWLLESNNVIAKDPHKGYRFIYAVNENSVWDHSGETG